MVLSPRWRSEVVDFVALFIGDLSVPTWAGDRRYSGIFGDFFEMWVLAGGGTVKRLEVR